MYVVTLDRGNGYHCGCCRRVNTYTEEFNTLAELYKFLGEIKFNQAIDPEAHENGDVSITSIIEVAQYLNEDDLMRNYEVCNTADALLKKHQDHLNALKVEEADKALSREKAQYEKLKEKFG
jgi:hypothetical protein